MKIRCMLGGICMLTSMVCHGDDWSLNAHQAEGNALSQGRAMSGVLPYSSSNWPATVARDLMRGEPSAVSSGENWLTPSDVEKRGLVLQRQRGALHLQYKF